MQWASRMFGTGLLSPEMSEEERRRLGQGALMDAGLAMLANSDGGGGTGAILAQGLMAGRQAYGMGAQQLSEQRAAQAKAQQEAEFLQALSPEQRRLAQILGVGPFAKANMEQQGKVALERTKAELKPRDSFRDLTPEEAKRRGYDPTKAWQVNEATNKVSQVGGNGVQVTNNLPGAVSPFAKALAAKDADTFSTWRDQAMAAGNVLDNLEVLGDINALQQGGRLGEVAARLGEITGSDASANRQAFLAAQRDLVLTQTARLSGAISEGELALIEQSLPQFGNDPRANQIIIDILRRAAEKAVNNYQSADRYVMERGDLRGFSPLIRSAPASAPNNAAKIDLNELSADQLEAEIRRRRAQ